MEVGVAEFPIVSQVVSWLLVVANSVRTLSNSVLRAATVLAKST